MTGLATTPTAVEGHLLTLADLSQDDWNALLAVAEDLADPARRAPLLAGRRVGLLLLNRSMRTLASFQAACFDLGAHPIVLQPEQGGWGLEHRDGVVMDGVAAEHVKEAVPVLGRYVDGLGVRAFAGLLDVAYDRSEPVMSAVVAHATVPVLNLESAYEHPHQGLADALTLRRRLGERSKVVVRWAPHVRPLPRAVPHSALLAFAREGHDVVLCHPEGYDLDDGIVVTARQFAADAGGSVTVTQDRAAAASGARVIYAKSWGSEQFYGDPQRAVTDLAAHVDWRVTTADLKAADNPFFMHCLPVRRNFVVTDAVVESPASIVIEQAGARLDVQKATLCRAFGVEA